MVEIFILEIKQFFVLQSVHFMPLHASSTCAHHQEVKIALHSLWYHQTYRWPSLAQVERGLSVMIPEAV